MSKNDRLSDATIESIRQQPEHHNGEFDHTFDEQSFARAVIKADRELRGEIGGYRYRYSESEKWNHGATPQNLWECQPLYTVPKLSKPMTELHETVMAALDDIKLVLDGTMGEFGLQTTFVSLVEALEPERIHGTDWSDRYQNAVSRFKELSHIATAKAGIHD
jgi:hypothetical protein